MSLENVGRFVQGLRKKFQDELAAASTTAEESIGNIRTVRSFSQERKAMSNYKADIDKSYDVGAKLALASGTLIVTPYHRASFLGGGGVGGTLQSLYGEVLS